MKFLRFFGNEIILGSLIAILSVMTALASFQGSTADSKQNEHEILGMQQLNDGNAEYLSANQFIVYDYTMFDGWYTTDDEEKSAYFEENYSEELQTSIEANPDDPFTDEYYDAMYTPAYDYWDESDINFDLAGQWDNRGDKLVMLLMALALALAACLRLFSFSQMNNESSFFVLPSSFLHPSSMLKSPHGHPKIIRRN
jgi:hypothetical protein